MLQKILWVACLGVAITLGACSGNGSGVVPASYQSSDLQGEQALAQARVRATTASYTLRPNDQLRIQVYNEPTISGDYQVDGAGSLSIPLAGHVKAIGLTPTELERTITMRLNKSGMLKDAHVNVQVANYAPFYIHGEVKRPGEFAYKPGLTVLDAVALAGGYTYRADESRVFVRSAGAAGEIVRSLDANVPVAPGANIRIPERFF
jgi:polysaccharide biosynthesis/export protein